MSSATKKKHQKQVVLAIFVNSRGFGFTIMESALKVLEAQIITIRPARNKMNLPRIKDKIDYYSPDVVVVENCTKNGSRKSKRIQKLISNITHYAKQQRLDVKQYSRADIRFVFSNFDAYTKHEIATVISENIPKLKDRLMEKRKDYESEKYTAGLFDAVSLGITHFYMTD